jgi:hypothetical protein
MFLSSPANVVFLLWGCSRVVPMLHMPRVFSNGRLRLIEIFWHIYFIANFRALQIVGTNFVGWSFWKAAASVYVVFDRPWEQMYSGRGRDIRRMEWCMPAPASLSIGTAVLPRHVTTVHSFDRSSAGNSGGRSTRGWGLGPTLSQFEDVTAPRQTPHLTLLDTIRGHEQRQPGSSGSQVLEQQSS